MAAVGEHTSFPDFAALCLIDDPILSVKVEVRRENWSSFIDALLKIASKKSSRGNSQYETIKNRSPNFFYCQ